MLKPEKSKRPEQAPSFLGKEQLEQSPAAENKEKKVVIEKSTEQEGDQQKVVAEKAFPTPAQNLSTPLDPVTAEIRQVMSQDLQDIYAGMDPATQKTFKEEGRKAADQIKEILLSGKVQARKIFKLLFDWLKIIPGVNKFFIKQEAKIKTDRLINLNKK